MRTPSFMQGVVARPSVPAKFGRLEAVQAPSQPAPTPPPPPMVQPSPSPVAFPVALAELRPPPTPPPPAPPPARGPHLEHAIEKLTLQNERLAELARSDALEIGFMV